jgi:hypothetical protein
MSTEPPEPTNLPVKGATPDVRGSYLAADIQPPIELPRKRGHEFAGALADYIEPNKVELDADRWRFTRPLRGGPHSRFEIILQDTRIQVSAVFPGESSEWLEERFREVLLRFEEFFRPQILIGSAAMVQATWPINGDARIFLATHIMHLDLARVNRFNRPTHVVGLRFSLPPHQLPEGEGGQDWLLELKAESLVEDPAKVFLEADARWVAPGPWTHDTIQTLIEHSVTVSDSMRKYLLGFLGDPEAEGAG